MTADEGVVPLPATMNRSLASAVIPPEWASLRATTPPREERYRGGRQLRTEVPRSSLARWEPSCRTRDAVDVVEEANEGRLDWLVPIRIGRMLATPYSFLRGAAGVMAEDFSQLPATGIVPVICGDAHLGNFGFYASPERDLVFDLNDFDEAHTGSWEWDLRRLTASVHVAGRQNGFPESTCGDAVMDCVHEYRRRLQLLAGQPLLARSYERLDIDRLREATADWALRPEIDRAARRARNRTSDRALPRFTERRDGVRRLVEQPPLIVHMSDEETDRLVLGLDDYLATLPPHWRRLLGGYTVRDVALKVVGVGSVGLRAYVALCEGSGPDDMLFLQLKQARRSVVARFVHGDAPLHAHQGQRVVEYQQALQTVSDPLLGWTTIDDRQYYVRQFRDMKGAIAVDGLDPLGLGDYARLCGLLLAKGHARTSGASRIAGYLGRNEAVAEALRDFARAYADQTERDHAALAAAVKAGRLPAEHGV